LREASIGQTRSLVVRNYPVHTPPGRSCLLSLEFLTDIEIADARSTRYCKGYPECNDCACTRKVRFEGEPLLDHLRRTVAKPDGRPNSMNHRPTRWLGWRGNVSPAEALENRAGVSEET
jgi:hypothetical protein